MPAASQTVLDVADPDDSVGVDPLAVGYRRSPSGRILRETTVGSRGAVVSSVADRSPSGLDAASAFQQSWLRSLERPSCEQTETVRAGDLFCGVGGLSVGLEEAAWGLGMGVEHAFAADLDQVLLGRYRANFGAEVIVDEPIETVLDGEFGTRETATERAIRRRVGELDVILAGPPCQGHSDLNNHTRRDDPRNALYALTIRAAEIFSPRHLLIENVPGVVHDRSGVVGRALRHLEGLGYFLDSGVVRAEDVGVPQKRRRFFLLASRVRQPSIEMAMERSRGAPRPVGWALGGLGSSTEGAFDTSARHSAENRRRIGYLLEHDLYELPDSQRPACHRDKAHSYRSVYGRMRGDQPAPTITVGFGSTGQGRFVHPSEPRTLTPHEAARVQTFPDWFDFGDLKRTQLQKAIGNAVPPLMASVVLRELLIGDFV